MKKRLQAYQLWLVGRPFQLHDVAVLFNPLAITVRLLGGEPLAGRR